MTSPYLPIGGVANVLMLAGLLFREAGFLDLTQFEGRIPQAGRGWGSGAIVGVEGGKQVGKIVSLKITLVPLDSEDYALGERFIYEVRLENISGQSLVVPWEPEGRKIYPHVEDEKPPPGAEGGIGAVTLFALIQLLNNNVSLPQGLYQQGKSAGLFTPPAQG